MLEHMRAGIEDLVGYLVPTESEEEADPTDADQRYEVAVGILRVATRAVNGGVKVGRVGGRLLSIGDRILYRLPSFIGL